MFSDFRSAFHSLARQRIFSLVTIFTLALGIGGAAAIFSIAQLALFPKRKLPSDLYIVCVRDDRGSVRPALNDYMVRGVARSDALQNTGTFAGMSGNVVIDGQPVATDWIGVSPGLFPLLGARPVLGRDFLPSEKVEGADQVVVISRRLWHQRFADSPDILGRKVTLGSAVCTIVGVIDTNELNVPWLNNDFFRPLTYRVDPQRPWAPQLFMLGTLGSGRTVENANAILNAAEFDVPALMRTWEKPPQLVLASLPEFISSAQNDKLFWVLLGAVGFLYAIACLNASNLVLVRMLGQRRDLSIRLALGAGRARIVRQLLAESLTLAILGTLAGIVVANWLFPVLLRLTGSTVFTATREDWSLDGRQLALMGALTVCTSLLIVAVPIIRVLRAPIFLSLKDGGAALGESRGLARLRGSLVVLQSAFAVVLLAGAGLMIRTVHNLQHVDLGFDSTNRLKVRLAFPPGYPSEWEPRLARLREIQAVIERIPGVSEVGFSNDLVLQGYFVGTHTVEGAGGQPLKAMIRCFSLGFQDAAGLKLKSGRWLNRVRSHDVMVSEALARACWPGRDPVGQLMRPVGAAPAFDPDFGGWTVVGVVADMRMSLREAPGLYFYSDEAWNPVNYDTFIVHLSAAYGDAIAAAIRRELYAFDPQLAVNSVTTLDQLREGQLWAEHVADAVLKVLAGTAGLLTLTGIFSMLAYMVDCRMSEFGLRMAFGATARNLTGLVIRRGMKLALGGLAIGIGATFGLVGFLRAILYETSAQDPQVLLAVALVLIGGAALGALLPAYRATKADVVKLLRAE